MTDDSSYIFWPQQIGPYETELQRLLVSLEYCADRAEVSEILTQYVRDIPDYPHANVPRLRYRAYLLVMRDLLRQGWTHICRQGRIYLAPPAWTEPTNDPETIRKQKTAIREALNYERLAQLRKPSVRRFIQDMEHLRPFNGHMVSIRSLLADGAQLARDLAAIVSQPDEFSQRRAIRTVIQPYLQLVMPNSRCPYTGLLLNDIWRYMRYTWSIPYNSTPGRNMFYLVRDASRLYHPVIGIAALGNSMVQITARDDCIGWTPQAIFDRIRSDKLTDEDARRIADMLTTTLQAVLDDLATEDLVSEDELVHPTEVTLIRLQHIADTARAQRLALLQERRVIGRQRAIPPGQLLLDMDDNIGEQEQAELIEQRSHEALFLAKRALTLRALLAARLIIGQLPQDITSPIRLRTLISTERGRQAVQTLVRENKKRKVGINMMDIIICGAVPPYNAILGGKLVSMLIVGPKVVYDYYQKYRDYISHIASQMKQDNVLRKPYLVFLGTTSLYHVGSSQYNRITIPVDGNGTKMSYKKYGKTIGFGSVHFSSETVQALNDLQANVREAILINNRFGEGVNPKLRRVSAGLSDIGLENSDIFTNHRSKRIVYGVPLGQAAYAYLRGETEDPQYFFDVVEPSKIDAAMKYIAEYWAERWLLMRIKNKSVLKQIASYDINHILLSSVLATEHITSEDSLSCEASS